jgi:uncharacterized membrane protein
LTSGSIVLVITTFLASAVEMVEALTIVLAAGMTRGWRSALVGVAAAFAALAAIVALLGPALAAIPFDILRLVVGALLLIFGLQWLRKAILRAGGYKALHDEDAIFAREVAEARAHGREARAGLDWYAFTLCFKGVLLEGLEVAFIVVTFGAAQRQIGLAAVSALAALAVVLALGAAIHRPLSRAPENTLKFGVGLMLASFGTFWAAEGVGVTWPGADAALLGLLAAYTAASLAFVWGLRRRRAAQLAEAPMGGAE